MVFGVWLDRRAERRLLARWRVLDRRAWASAMRNTRGAWPLNVMRISRAMRPRFQAWFNRTPEWARDDPAARAALRSLRLAALPIVVGWFTFMLTFM
jgi:hypothetical protein